MILIRREVCWSLALCLSIASCGDEPPPTTPLDPGTAAKVEAARERAEVDSLYTADDRLRLLLAPCVKGGYYDRDAGDTLGILIDKLQNGSSDTLHRAKEELAELGALAAPEVARLLNLNFDDPMGGAKVQNCIEVLGMMRADVAHTALMKCLDHPRDTVRGSALRALAHGAARPEDFERILAHLPVERVHLREQASIALFAADPDRAALTLLDWLPKGINKDVWQYMSTRLQDADPSLLVEPALALFDKLDPSIGLPLAAIALAAGEPGPRAFIDQYLHSENGAQRMPAVAALLQQGHLQEVAGLATSDPDSVIRSLVLTWLADGVQQPDKATLEAFHSALDDPSPDVRKLALGVLLGWGDPEASDRALSALDGGRSELQEVILTLITAFEQRPEFAARAEQKLVAADQSRSQLPLAQRLAVLQALGQVPSVTAADYLFDLAQEATGELQGLRAHRWLMIQAANTGPVGRAELARLLEQESEPARRLDVIFAISGQPDSTARDFLVDFVERDVDPYEVLFAAERLARIGPTSLVAPLLKRVALRIEHPDVRRALECLLWRWY